MSEAIDTVFDVMSGIIEIVEANGCKDEEDIRPWLSERLAAHASQKAEIERLKAALQGVRDMVWPMDISTDRVSATLRIIDAALAVR